MDYVKTDEFQNRVSEGNVNWEYGSDSRLEKLSEGFYSGINFGFGNVGFVITEEGVVVIDSTISRSGARAVIKEIRKLTNKPIKYLIYTHGHGDHVGGASVFKEEGATVIGHRNVNKRFDRYTKLNEHHLAINSLQFKKKLTSKVRKYVYPDITYDQEYTFELGGKTFRLIHGKGETDDATVIYIPENRICFIGDFIIWAFPNIGNPNKVIRYEREWYEMLDRILSLRPKAIGVGHGRSLIGRQEIEDCLGDTSNVLKYLHEECVKHINKMSSLDKMLSEIKVPEKLANSPYIKELYGCREFVIRGIHRRYTGWYDGNPTSLSSSPVKEVNRVIFDLIGSKEKIIRKAKDYHAKGKNQLSLHLIDLILIEDPEDKEMHLLKANVLKEMSSNSNNLFFRNFYSVNAEKEIEVGNS
ncbi:alkyl sulfatase dimerization domain-containing protein [Lentibacillus sp. Marseille-P4043]|uniref:alkyl sulfatase dimerization domain-containing protein n=1 Tax=Lentibacillus sp. Marseille-P4043 TaxID=2040293 RepID=UPI000D0BE2A9|nr:alkyl sulfatase dimerization domain-containing protein [Lentibacillus sp. Marseille-P4043]